MQDVNNQAATVDSIINTAVFTVALNAAKSAMIADQSWLALPVINQIFSSIMNTIAKYVYKQMSRTGTFLVIDLQTEKEKSAYQQAADALKAARASGDQNAINLAVSNFKTAAAALIHYDGSAS